MENKIKYTKTELPKEWIDEGKRKEFRERITAIENRINGELRTQVEAEGLEFDLALVNAMRKSQTAIKDKMKLAFDDYMKSVKFIPKAEKKRVEDSFLAISERLEISNMWLFNALRSIPVELKKDKELICFDKAQTEAYISTIGVHTFTDEEHEYYKLLDDAIELLVKAHNFEVEHKLPSYATQSMNIVPSFTKGVPTYYQAYGVANDAKEGKPNINHFLNLRKLKELKALESNLND